MITISLLLLVAAFLCVILAALGKCPVWIPVLLVILIVALQIVPK